MSGSDDSTRMIEPDKLPVPALRPGQKVFGRYTLESIAGRGGMGVVWRARDDELERAVALKFLPDAVASDAEAVRDLKIETRRCLDLTHPHIVRVHDFIQGTAGAAIAMEFVEGESLAARKVASPNGCLSVAEVTRYTGPLCAALDYAHFKAQLLHRDLKPANLLVTTAGDLKVMDFGIACSLADTRSRLTQAANRTTSGTLQYMSPQQLLGGKPSIADDIYALGATLYELIAGKPPFFRGDGYALMMQIREQPPKPMSVQRADLQISGDPIPDLWEKVVLACLAKEPQNRPQSAGEVAQMLGVATDKPLRLLATNPSPNSGLPSGAQSAVPPSPATPPTTTASTVTPVAAPPPSKRGRWIGAAAAVVGLAVVGVGLFFLKRTPEPVKSAAVASPTGAASEPPPATDAKTPFSNSPASATAAPVNPAAAAATPPVTGRGGAIIRTTPAGAEVTVGALEHGPSPLTVRDAKVGTYPVKIRLNGYEEWSGEVAVKENDFAEVNVKLERSTGTLVVTSEPTDLSGELVGKTTPGGPPPGARQTFKTPRKLTLPTGAYELTFRRAGWPDQKSTIEVGRNQVVESSGVFATGQLIVTSEPAGAEVVLDGKPGGLTPFTLNDVQPGPRNVTLKLKGYQPASVSGVVEARGALRLNAVLEKPQVPAAGSSTVVPGLDLELKFIPAGKFVLGSPASEPGRDPSEGPQTEVTLTQGFWIGKTEITQRQYQSLMGVNPSRYRTAGLDAPVESLSWYDVSEFCRRLNERERAAGRLPEGYAYTLPTEAQWEYACRAGATGASNGELANFAWIEKAGGRTQPVASRTPNAWGLYDMSGNVWEWCLDAYADRLPGGSIVDYAGPAEGALRVRRGGAWNSPAKDARFASRLRGAPGEGVENVGFRIALSTPQTGKAGVAENKSGKSTLGGIGAGAKSVWGSIVNVVKPDEKRVEPAAVPQQGVLVVTIAKAPPAPFKFTLVLTRTSGGAAPIELTVDESVTRGRNDRGAFVARVQAPAGSYAFALKCAGFKDATRAATSAGEAPRNDQVTIRGGGETTLEFELEPMRTE